MSGGDALSADDEVRYIGPSGPASHWPGTDELGVVSHVRNGTVIVVWERTPLIAAWPSEWICPT